MKHKCQYELRSAPSRAEESEYVSVKFIISTAIKITFRHPSSGTVIGHAWLNALPVASSLEAVRLVMATLAAEVDILVSCMGKEKTQTAKKSRKFTEQQ